MGWEFGILGVIFSPQGHASLTALASGRRCGVDRFVTEDTGCTLCKRDRALTGQKPGTAARSDFSEELILAIVFKFCR